MLHSPFRSSGRHLIKILSIFVHMYLGGLDALTVIICKELSSEHEENLVQTLKGVQVGHQVNIGWHQKYHSSLLHVHDLVGGCKNFQLALMAIEPNHEKSSHERDFKAFWCRTMSLGWRIVSILGSWMVKHWLVFFFKQASEWFFLGPPVILESDKNLKNHKKRSFLANC